MSELPHLGLDRILSIMATALGALVMFVVVGVDGDVRTLKTDLAKVEATNSRQTAEIAGIMSTLAEMKSGWRIFATDMTTRISSVDRPIDTMGKVLAENCKK